MRTKFSGILTLFMAFVVQLTFAQEKTITGTVTDAESGMPLAGVNIIIEGTSTGTQSDFDGNYQLRASQGQTLEFTYVGYTTKKVTVGAESNISITMSQSSSELEEVIVTAYGTTTKANTTQAVTTITVDNIESRPNASVVQSLQGQVAGLNIGSSTGQPGADGTVILRGPGSMNGNIEPLFVLDGIPIDEDNFRSINPNNIASVSILKDAAATSIYGNRGANGVIVITTKGGKYNQKLQIRYSSQYGVSQVADLSIELMNSKQKLTFQRDNAIAGSPGFGMSDAEIAAFASHTNTNWADYFFRTGTYNNQNVSFTTGSENTNSFTSIGYLEQEGTFIASELQRFNFRNNFNGKSENGKFTYSTKVSVNFSKSDFDESAANQVFFSPFLNATQGSPLISPYDPDGSVTTDGGLAYGDVSALEGKYSPIVLLNSAHWNTKRDEELKMLGGLQLDYQFNDNFSAGYNLGIDYTSVRYYNLLHPLSLLGPFQVDSRAEFGGIETHSFTRDARFSSLFTVGYQDTFNDKHTVGVNLYAEYLKSHYNSSGFEARGIDPKTIGSGNEFKEEIGEDYAPNDPTLQPYIPNVFTSNYETGMFSYFGTVDYDYDGRYGLYASIRRDASFRFVDDNQWGTFYAISGRWNISEEDFMQGSKFNLLKLRASYGTSGNQRILGAYYAALNETQSLYTSGAAYNGTSGYVLSQIGNRALRWEQTEQVNFGLDFALWNNKLQGNVDVYRKTTTDLFQSRPISLINATPLLLDNIGSMENEGVELFLKYTVYDDADWNFSVSGNGSYNKNTILELAGADEDGIIRNTGVVSPGEGHAFGSFYAVRYAGVNPSNGEALFYDADGNLTTVLDADNDRVFTGKGRFPKWQGGFGAVVSYKGFSFSNQWVFFADVYRNNVDLVSLEGSSNYVDANSSTSVLRSWKQPGDITDMPRLYEPIGFQFINLTDRYIQDASYLRLRNVTLGYTFQENVLNNLPFTSLKLYLQGENLLTFSKWQGWDAESSFTSGSRSVYPSAKVYTVGINANF